MSEQEPTSAVPRPTLRGSGHRPLREMVPPVRAQLSRCPGANARGGLPVDHSTLWRWVQRYAAVLNRRLCGDLRRPNGSWRVDETYIRLGGRWVYLYGAVDSTGDTIEFMLSPNRDLVAARHFLQLALSRTSKGPRVLNVERHPAYAAAISELKQSGELARRCCCRCCLCLNNLVEQDHRFNKKRTAAALWFRLSPVHSMFCRGSRRCT